MGRFPLYEQLASLLGPNYSRNFEEKDTGEEAPREHRHHMGLGGSNFWWTR